ncbi:hypothetical protein MACH01_10900 [Thalassospira tepidiphila]|nr:hypothetical protein MACH01_10900 [Thalassospira tepidiphila]
MLMSWKKKWVKYFGTLEEKERFNTIKRASYAHGMIKAALYAREIGVSSISAIEFGVSTGGGLMAMERIARLIEDEYGIKVHVVGYDNGKGLPDPVDYKDHPEIWGKGDFVMFNKDQLLENVKDSEIVFGDVKDTAGEREGWYRSNPIAFISIDVDYYSSTMSCLEALKFHPDCYLPAVSMYFDDISFFTANRWCGELLAIDDFNAANEKRKIDIDRTLPGNRPYQNVGWYRNMYVGHILDHTLRSVEQ